MILPSCASDWIQLYQGVPQGTVFGPLLFNINVNSLYTCIEHIESAVESLELNVNNICDFFKASIDIKRRQNRIYHLPNHKQKL